MLVVFQNGLQIERKENADRKKNEAEQCAREHGGLVIRCGERREFKFDHSKRGGCENDKEDQHRKADGFERAACLKRVFVAVGVVIADHQNRSPNGKHNAGQHGKCEIAE